MSNTTDGEAVNLFLARWKPNPARHWEQPEKFEADVLALVARAREEGARETQAEITRLREARSNAEVILMGVAFSSDPLAHVKATAAALDALANRKVAP